MITIVIGDGLTNEFLSPEVQFQDSLLHVGLQEIDRLMGSGQDFGTGPLPTFIQEVAAANGRGVNTSLLLLQNFEDSTDVAFIEPLREAAKTAEVLHAPYPDLPFHEFRQAVERLTAQRRAERPEESVSLSGVVRSILHEATRDTCERCDHWSPDEEQIAKGIEDAGVCTIADEPARARDGCSDWKTNNRLRGWG